MQRRHLLKGAVGLAVMGGGVSISAAEAGHAAVRPMQRRVRPYDPAWPTLGEWQALSEAVGGRLERVVSPLEACARRIDGSLCAEALADLGTPFFIQDQAGATQTAGWIDGWTSAPSVYAVSAAGAADVAAAVNFAREKNLRLVVKGGAHSYLGQSNSADSLMIWTKHMDALELHDAFVPQGCAGTVPPQPAVSVGSGATFIELYDFVTTQHGRYVQGGGCTSVGIGGHVQTGGFGSFSKYGGLVAASLLEAEIVTAEGEIRIVNACSYPDLLLALKGGGAGFGVTTRLTLATRPLPNRFGFLGQTIKAASDEGFRRLLGAFCGFTRETLINPHWGEQVTFTPDNALEIAMVFQGLSDDEARAAWAPFADWLSENPADIADVYDEGGQCVRIPALPDVPPPRKARVRTYRATLRYGLVWVSLGEPAQDPPPFPEWQDDGFRKLLCGPYPVEASGPRIVENFLDVAHFPFVHENILGTPDRPEIADHRAVIGAAGVEATGVRVWQPDPYGTGQGDWVSYTYRALRPLTAYLLKESAGPRFSILLTITPHEPARSTAWMWMAMNYGHDIPEADLVAWQDRIFSQDRPILESQRPELLPLDLAAELNVRADRTAVMYRRWLRQLGLTFGTA